MISYTISYRSWIPVLNKNAAKRIHFSDWWMFAACCRAAGLSCEGGTQLYAWNADVTPTTRAEQSRMQRRGVSQVILTGASVTFLIWAHKLGIMTTPLC